MYSEYKPSSRSPTSFLEFEEHGDEMLVESGSDLHLKSTVQIQIHSHVFSAPSRLS